MFKIETQNNFVTKINDIDIDGEIAINDYYTINRAILMSLISLSLDKKPITVENTKYSGGIIIRLKNFYISHGWTWYKYSKDKFMNDINISKEEFDLICNKVSITLASGILKQNCVLIKKLYYSLISNSSLNNNFEEYCQTKPILESKISEFFKF